MKDQKASKRFKTSSSTFTPYDRKTAQKENMLDEIISNQNVAEEKMFLNPYPTNTTLKSSAKRPLSESKTFDFDDIKKNEIQLDDVLKDIGWKQFGEIDEATYTNLVQNFYSSATMLEGHDVILCCMNQIDIIITTDILSKVFNILNSGMMMLNLQKTIM